MNHTKKLTKRIAAGVMSAALLVTGTTVCANKQSTVVAADNDYYQALALSLYFYDANECGSAVKDGPLTWRGNCHTEDGKLKLSNATNFDSSLTSLVDPDGDGCVDMDGGYHDAGDHIKFNLTMGFGFSSLAMSEYLNPGIYEKAGCKDHLISICKKNADYLMKSTFLDSSGEVATICYVVADGGADHSMMTPPEEQHYDRASYWLTKNSNNSACCGEMAAALAGCAYLCQNSDPSYAKECLKYAKAIYNFGTNHGGNFCTGQAPFYETNADSQDELLLASAWLYICGEGSEPSTKPSNGKYNGNYDCYRYTWDKVYQGYAALMYKKTKNAAFKQELEYEVSNAGGVSAGKYNGDGWGAARYNCGLQMTALAAADGNKDSDFAKGCKWQMDYILGGNPLGYSFLIGYGNKWPTHIHHRAANPGDLSSNPAVKYTLYGGLVGGIDASGNYEDHSDKYQYTEGALDYNGCAALALAGLANLYGGSDKGASQIVGSASEFKKGYTFGSGSSGPVVTPTEPAPTEQQQPATQPTTQPPQQETQPSSQGGSQKATVTEKQGEDKSYWSIDCSGADKLTITIKISGSAGEANGVFNPPGGWNPTDWKANVVNNTITLTYDNKNKDSFVDVHVWYPDTIVSVEAVKEGGSVQQETQPPTQPATQPPTQPATQPPTQPATQPPTQSQKPSISLIGDANCDGALDIMDVIKVNKYLLGAAQLDAQAFVNADMDGNNDVNSSDSLAILKRVVGL